MAFKQKKKLSFEELEREVELLDVEEQKNIKGGNTIYRYETDPNTGMIEQYHSYNNGMSWFQDYTYQGGFDSSWDGPPDNSSGSGGVNDGGTGMLTAYESYLKSKKYTGNKLTDSEKQYNTAIEEMLGQLECIQTNSLFNVTLGYAIDEKGRPIRDSEYGGLTVAEGEDIDVSVYKRGNGVYDYSLIAHELRHVYGYFSGEIEEGTSSGYTKEDEWEAYKLQQILTYRAGYFDDMDTYNRKAYKIVNENYNGEKEGFPKLDWADDPYDSGSTGFTSFGSTGVFSTGFDNNGTYWENYFIYEEEGMYSAEEGPFEEALANYSTGYNYFSSGSSSGY